jgi:hypothetical protein
MNKIVHETVNNTVFDVETKMHFEEVYEIFEKEDNHKLSIISKQISKFNFIQEQWIELINYINPFNPNLVMANSQKFSFPYFNFIIKFASDEDLLYLCNEFDSGFNKGLINMVGVINNGYKLFRLLEKKLDKKIIWFKYNYPPILDIARYGNIQNYLFLENKMSLDQIIKLNNDLTSYDIFANICHNPDMRLMKDFLDKYNSSFKFDNINCKSMYFKGILSSHIPPKYQMRRLKLLNDYYSLAEYYPKMLENLNGINFKTFMTISKYYYKESISSNYKNSNINVFYFLREFLNEQYQILGNHVVKEIFRLFTSINIFDLKELLRSFYLNECLNFQLIDDLNHEIEENNYNDTLSIQKLLTSTEKNKSIIKYVKVVSDYEYTQSDCAWRSLNYFLDSPNFYDSTTASNFIKSILSNYQQTIKYQRNIIYFILLTKVHFKIPSNISKFNLESIYKGIRVRSVLKRALFRKINNSRKKQKINFKIVLNNLLTFKPNYDVPVLSKGSCLYRKSKQKLEKHKYPIHIDPCQMVWLSRQDCLLREKALMEFIQIVYHFNIILKLTFLILQ